MERHRIIPLLFVLCLLGARVASAQDARTFGVTMGYPATVGVLWHVNDKLAVRPEVSFVHSSSETESTPPIADSTSDGNAFSVGLSAVISLARWDMTRAYVVPRYAYGRTTSSINGPFTIQDDVTATTHSMGVSFGAQHALGERFAVYGELGLVYEKSDTEVTTSELHRNSFGTRSGVGVVVYF